MVEAPSIFTESTVNLFNRFLLPFVEVLPESPRNRIYRYCKRYVDCYEGNNNEVITTNGELEVIRKYVPHCDIVFDVGAHVGEWAKLVLELNPKAGLHCFEPSAHTFKRLASQNFLPNIVCNNFGLSSRTSEVKLFVFEEGSTTNSLSRRAGLQDRGIEPQEKEEIVMLKTLDNYCFEKHIDTIDFLKIDVEGHELEVLQGSKEMLARKQ